MLAKLPDTCRCLGNKGGRQEEREGKKGEREKDSRAVGIRASRVPTLS